MGCVRFLAHLSALHRMLTKSNSFCRPMLYSVPAADAHCRQHHEYDSSIVQSRQLAPAPGMTSLNMPRKALPVKVSLTYHPCYLPALSYR